MSNRPIVMYVVAAIIAPNDMSRTEQARIRDTLDMNGVGERVRQAVQQSLDAIDGAQGVIVEVSR